MTQAVQKSECFTMKQVAAILEMSRQRLYHYINEGDFTTHKFLRDRRKYIPKEEVINFIRRTVGADAAIEFKKNLEQPETQ